MKQQLFILWTNDNPITSEKMVCMYSSRSIQEGWWEKVTIIVWGATVTFLASDKHIQGRIKQIIADGVKVSVCRSCAEQLDVIEEIEALGIEHKYWGAPLTEIIKSGQKLITV